MIHQPLSLTENPTIPMAFSSMLRSPCQGWIFASARYSIVIDEQPVAVFQAAQMMSSKSRVVPDWPIQYTAAASVFYRASASPNGPSRIPIAVVALEHSAVSTDYEPVGLIGRLLGRRPKPLEVFVRVWHRDLRMNHGAIQRPITAEAARTLLLAKASEVIGEDPASFRLAGSARQGPDCDAMR